MLFRKYIDRLSNANAEIRFLRWLVAWVGVIVLVQAAVIVRLAGAEKTVIVPPEIKRSFWVSRDTVSKEYLEEMAYWYAGLALNVTPTASDYQNSLFLKYAAPSEYGLLQSDLGARFDFLKKNNAATQFSVRTITVDDKNLRVALSGTLYTWVSDKKASERQTVFMVGFKQINGTLYVSSFKETSDQDPFGDAATGQH